MWRTVRDVYDFFVEDIVPPVTGLVVFGFAIYGACHLIWSLKCSP